jgi:hypothetical protein
MKIKFGAIVVDGRNKIGGHVMSKNRAGAYMRTKVTPVNPSSQYQSAVRARLSTISQNWKTLDAAAVLAWNQAVDAWKKTDIFGDIHAPSGINLYQRLNNNAYRGGGGYISDPPVPAVVSDLVRLTATIVDSTSVTLGFGLAALGTNEVLEVLASPPIRPSVSFGKNRLRIIVSTAAITTSAYVATVPYEANFGDTYAAGNKIFFAARIINTVTGQTSGTYKLTAVVPAD